MERRPRPSSWLLVAAGLWAGIVLWRLSNVHVGMEWGIGIWASGLVIALAWGWQSATRRPAAGRSTPHLRAWLFFPVVLAVAVALYVTQAPLKARVFLSESALEACATRMLASKPRGEPTTETPRRLGAMFVHGAWVGHGCVYFPAASGWMWVTYGIAYVPEGVEPQPRGFLHLRTSHQHLYGRWWRFSASA